MNRFAPQWFSRHLSFDRSCLKLAAVSLLAGLMVGVLGMAARAQAADDPPGEKKIPAPLDIELQTTDGLQMQATYYGSIQGKNAVPIIMLHGYKGSRADFAGLALAMQARGCAVIVPDLRGHGKSTSINRGGELVTIDPSTLRKGDFELMVTQDLEAVKSYLMERNNAGELNIEKLCVVGNDMGAMLAVKWSQYDWHWPQLPSTKQGQDVKAVVLISPPMNFHGIPINDSLGTPLLQTGLSVLIIAGEKNSKAMDEAKRIYNRLAPLRPKPTDDREVMDKQDLFLSTVKAASLQGPNILNDKSILPQLTLVIGQFIEWRLVNKKFPWTDRKPALGQ
ncbi:MAG TPA: alpha/beta fold hydrolase [Pirellulales bacterium]|nr:alpha/beta fold hydrolase [Pirellulales bacterium]